MIAKKSKLSFPIAINIRNLIIITESEREIERERKGLEKFMASEIDETAGVSCFRLRRSQS